MYISKFGSKYDVYINIYIYIYMNTEIDSFPYTGIGHYIKV